MKRVLGVAMLMLFACGSEVDTPTSGPDNPAQRESKPAAGLSETLRGHFVWSHESEPGRDWDADAAECGKSAIEDSSALAEPNVIATLGAFVACMEERGWQAEKMDS